MLPQLAMQGIVGTVDVAPQVERVASDWLRLLRCAAASTRRLHSFPDFSSPVNAAIMLVRPELTLYRAGLDVLRAAAGRPFDRVLGWEGVGRPLRTTPQGDDAWRRRKGHMQMLDRDSHDFVGASIDQGFFNHMMRVRNALGGAAPPAPPHRLLPAPRLLTAHCSLLTALCALRPATLPLPRHACAASPGLSTPCRLLPGLPSSRILRARGTGISRQLTPDLATFHPLSRQLAPDLATSRPLSRQVTFASCPASTHPRRRLLRLGSGHRPRPRACARLR